MNRGPLGVQSPIDKVQGNLRRCFRDPIPEFVTAASHLDEAASAHRAGRTQSANELIRMADMPALREWTESLWGSASLYVQHVRIADSASILPKDQRVTARMPTAAEKSALHERDGFRCRFCGIPVIRAEIRNSIRLAHPDALPWGSKNVEQHAGFQAMWLQYDHIVPHSVSRNGATG